MEYKETKGLDWYAKNIAAQPTEVISNTEITPILNDLITKMCEHKKSRPKDYEMYLIVDGEKIKYTHEDFKKYLECLKNKTNNG